MQANDLKSLGALGFTMPTPAYLFGLILFGIIGWVAYRYGKKTEAPTTKWLGVGMMLYPYAVSQTWLLYLVGVALCVCMYLFRD